LAAVALAEALPFERQHHRMHAWRRDLKEPLHVGFGRRATVDDAVVMDVGQELALPCGAGRVHHQGVLLVLKWAGRVGAERLSANGGPRE
jgi:hypothetical protein